MAMPIHPSRSSRWPPAARSTRFQAATRPTAGFGGATSPFGICVMREELICPSWAIYEAAAAHTNAQAFSEAEHRKQEATIPAVFRIGARVFVTCGAWWGAAPEGAPR